MNKEDISFIYKKENDNDVNYFNFSSLFDFIHLHLICMLLFSFAFLIIKNLIILKNKSKIYLGWKKKLQQSYYKDLHKLIDIYSFF